MLSNFASIKQYSYQEHSGYRQEGDYTFWEPTDPIDLEPATRNYGPGAMKVGEIDNYDGSDCEEF